MDNTHMENMHMEKEMEKRNLRLRAHHGMCLAFFEGKGYSDAFTARMSAVKSGLEEDPDQMITLVCAADDICSACPNDRVGACISIEKVNRYDRDVLNICGITKKQPALHETEPDPIQIPFSEFSRLVRENILDVPGKRRQICGDCQWNEICDR